MPMNPLNMVTFSLLVQSSIMAISSSNWIMLWVAMEINMLSFIPMLLSTKSNNENEAATKYFLAQALGSSLLLWSSLLPTYMISSCILTLSLLLKLGSFPCHFWFPAVMSSCNWVSCMLLATWQKLAPLSILAFMCDFHKLMFLVAALNSLMGGYLGMNQSNLHTIMAYSSINHMGWMMSLIYMNLPSYCMVYFGIYSMMSAPIFLLLGYLSVSTAKSLNKSMTNSVKSSLFLLLLSLGGLPPLTGFLPKLMTLSLLMEHGSLLMIPLIMGSLMSLYFYLSLALPFMFTPKKSSVLNSKNISIFLIIVSALSMVGIPLLFMFALTIFNKS